MMAEFLAMGGTDSGSFAMHSDKTSFFLLALKSVTEELKWTINRHLIPRMVDYNFPGVTEYPKLEHSRLDTRPVQEIATAVAALMGAKALTPTRDTEQNLREVLELPPLQDGEQSAGEKPEPLPVAPPPTGQVDPNADPNADPTAKQASRIARFAAGVDTFAAMERLLDDAEANIVDAVAEVQKKQVASLLALGAQIFQSGDRSRVEQVDIPFRSEVAKAVQGILLGLYKAGARDAASELSLQAKTFVINPIDPEDVADVTAFLSVRARALANLMGDRLKSTFTWWMLDFIRTGSYSRTELNAALVGLSDQSVKSAAGSVVSEALNLGRDRAAQRNSDNIEYAIYSSVLDKGTCAPCRREDGRTFKVGSAEYQMNRPPFHSCDGRGRCRCVYVFVLKSEGK